MFCSTYHPLIWLPEVFAKNHPPILPWVWGVWFGANRFPILKNIIGQTNPSILGAKMLLFTGVKDVNPGSRHEVVATIKNMVSFQNWMMI